MTQTDTRPAPPTLGSGPSSTARPASPRGSPASSPSSCGAARDARRRFAPPSARSTKRRPRRSTVNAQLRRAIERRYFDGDAGIWERFSAHPAPGRELLVVHDTEDRVVDVRQADLLAAAGGEVVRTTGLGHSRILGDPAVVTDVVAFLDRGRP